MERKTENHRIEMKKKVVVWASQTGNTSNAAELIAGEIGKDQLDLFEVSREVVSLLPEYDVVIAGTSTWGTGELPHGWLGVGARNRRAPGTEGVLDDRFGRD